MATRGRHRQQLPPDLEQIVCQWLDASAELAVVLRRIDYKRPPLRLVRGGPPPGRCIRGWLYRLAVWPLFFGPLAYLHPGFMQPGT